MNRLKATFLDWTWPPSINLARKTMLDIFSRLESGHLLIIEEKSGARYAFGQSGAVEERSVAKNVYDIPSVTIVVKRDSFWLRLLLFADIGFAEGYMLDDFECNDLTSFFRVCASFSHFFYGTSGSY